jgi:SulP family sulfate permease
MIHAVTLLAIVVFAAPLARFVSLAVLAAILLVVSYNMGEWKEIPGLLKLSRLEIATWLVTFSLTVLRPYSSCGMRNDPCRACLH